VDIKNLMTLVIVYRNPNHQNKIAPTSGYLFRLRINAIIRIHVGIRCMNNPTTVCRNVYPFPKMSAANMLMKAMKTIAPILGNRKRNLCDVFFIRKVYFLKAVQLIIIS
jgi:hypothetical protein